MGGDALLNSLAGLFRAERENGLYVDRVGLSSAYDGLVGESYILAVSAPSLQSKPGCDDKSDAIIELLFAKLSADQRTLIDRVRVYDSADEFERHAQCNFDESFYGFCEADLQTKSKIATLA